MEKTCAECNRLWEELAEATKAHIKLVGQQQLVAMQQHSALVAELEPLVKQAGGRREEARRAVREHDATHDAL